MKRETIERIDNEIHDAFPSSWWDDIELREGISKDLIIRAYECAVYDYIDLIRQSMPGQTPEEKASALESWFAEFE